jgi:hypothetical protein
MLMKALNIFFIVLFIASAALQYNDPDPWLWMPIYLYGAAVCWMALGHRYKPHMYMLGFCCYGLYALILFFDQAGVWSWMSGRHAGSIFGSMKAEELWIEQTREFFGLILLMTALFANRLYFRRRARTSRIPQPVL